MLVFGLPYSPIDVQAPTELKTPPRGRIGSINALYAKMGEYPQVIK
jgi:hypothetical protein